MIGRGGACFPVHLKWRSVKEAPASEKYIVCNAAEGEPDVKKDEYILEEHPERVIEGMRLARRFLEFQEPGVQVKSFIYINYYYFRRFKEDLDEFIMENDNINFIIKPDESGYIGGEESTILNIIEGKKAEPSLKPPFPTTKGLWGGPTLVNNVETFYEISLVNREEYDKKRFYTLGGKLRHKGVYHMPCQWTMEKILRESNNYPGFSFFVQVGGGASGQIWRHDQLKRKAGGAGSITVYSMKGHSPEDMIKNWIIFYINESCGQCTPCREGVYRIIRTISQKKINWHLLKDLMDNLREASFCGLGCSVPVPISSYIKNVLLRDSEGEINISEQEKVRIKECFNK